MDQLTAEFSEARRRIAELEQEGARRQQAEEALWDSEKRFRTIAETASDAIIIFDSQENLFYWNRAAHGIFGYWAGETRGRLLASIMSADSCEVFRREMQQILETGKSDLVGKAVEARGVRKDGSEFPLEISLASWKAKEEVFFTFIARDVTTRKQAEAALQQAYDEVEKRVEERTAELKRETAERERLQQEVIEAQQKAIRELSTPLVPITESILVLPLVGRIDDQRSAQILEVLLEGTASRRARVIILDITGVPVVDTAVANHFLHATQAVRLLGAECILVGISPEVAQTMVSLGIDLTVLVTRANLQSGLEYAMERLERWE